MIIAAPLRIIILVVSKERPKSSFALNSTDARIARTMTTRAARMTMTVYLLRGLNDIFLSRGKTSVTDHSIASASSIAATNTLTETPADWLVPYSGLTGDTTVATNNEDIARK